MNNISASRARELFLYRIIDGGIYLEKYIGRENVVDVPDEINGISVEHIGNGCFEDRYNLQEVKLPETLKTIDKNAFAGCKSLKAINIPDGITEIGEYAFKWCSSLTSFNMPSKVDEIKSGMFMCCYSLQDVNISDNIRKIDEGSFWRCENVSLIVPNTVEEIETGAFKGVNSEKVSVGNFSQRYFEEWPYGEDVISVELGKGIITGCDFVSKTKYSLEIEVEGSKKRVDYPGDFDKTFRFIYEENKMRHNDTVIRMRKFESA